MFLKLRRRYGIACNADSINRYGNIRVSTMVMAKGEHGPPGRSRDIAPLTIIIVSIQTEIE